MQQQNIFRFIAYIPTIGIVLFFILFGYSSTLYPGGSQADIHSIGYSWINNYWCNLMNENAMNGVVNPARPFAISAMIILCISLMFFFTQFSSKFSKSIFWKISIKWGGILSMIFAMLMFTNYHDLMTSLSSLFGILVVAGIIREVYRSGMTFYKLTGVFCILLLAINNYIYYSEVFIEYLPLIQKVTFALVLGWIVGLNFKISSLIQIKE